MHHRVGALRSPSVGNLLLLQCNAKPQSNSINLLHNNISLLLQHINLLQQHISLPLLQIRAWDSTMELGRRMADALPLVELLKVVPRTLATPSGAFPV